MVAIVITDDYYRVIVVRRSPHERIGLVRPVPNRGPRKNGLPARAHPFVSGAKALVFRKTRVRGRVPGGGRPLGGIDAVRSSGSHAGRAARSGDRAVHLEFHPRRGGTDAYVSAGKRKVRQAGIRVVHVVDDGLHQRGSERLPGGCRIAVERSPSRVPYGSDDGSENENDGRKNGFFHFRKNS